MESFAERLRSDNVADRGRAGQSHARCDHPQKNTPRCTHATVFSEVERQSFPNVREQGQVISPAALAVDDDLCRPPADVAKLESSDLSRAQTKSGEE